MTVDPVRDISMLLVAWSKGDKAALNEVVPLIYDELRGIARRHLRQAGEIAMASSGTLAHEAYLRLTHARGIRCESRAHFFALCSQMIRRILVDHARSQRYAKRGGGRVQIPLEEAVLGGKARGVDVEALDDALELLAGVDERKARVVELRYFGGLTIQETADVLDVSEETVTRDWRMARTWLFRQLMGGDAPTVD
jgi:RNA polymerase sigma-70 factor, ECF subfamily